jgi:hypothetical protein
MPSGLAFNKRDHSMRAIYLAPALLLSALAFSPASAAPVTQLPAPAVESPVILAQMHPHKGRPQQRNRGRFVAGHRYGSAPGGWHRYDRRPGDWRTRGCILVGPIWFCP